MSRIMHFVSQLLLVASAAAQPWKDYVLSPTSRTIKPVSVFQTTANVTSEATGPLGPDELFVLSGPNASITFDFGGITAGIPTINIQESQCKGHVCSSFGLPSLTCLGCQALGVAYSESELFVGQASDHSTFYTIEDGTVYVPMTNGSYTLPARWGRGSFRYLTLSLGPQTSPTTSVRLQFSGVHFSPQPNVPESELSQYSGYFFSSDDLLNRVWYAGVYTLQLCTISANSSANHLHLLAGGGWSEDSSVRGLQPTDVFLSEGAKRDRNPWSGDLDVSLKSALVSLNPDNLRALRNVLVGMLVAQDPVSRYFPYAGSPLGDLLALAGNLVGTSAWGSDTYHLWTIIGFAEYVLASGDKSFADEHWPQVLGGIEATYQYIDPATGLFNSTKPLDWGRIGQGGLNAAVNAIYFRALQLSIQLSTAISSANTTANTLDRAKWHAIATRLKTAFNAHLYDPAAGLYRDNTTAAGALVHPQDGNAHAINFNLTDPPSRARTVAARLSARLTRYGAPAPELPSAISPFVSSQELRAHFAASPGDASRAMALLRTTWGHMLHAFSNRTFVEGYAADGALRYAFYENSAPFISHAHAWSTGPVYSLMADLVGLKATRGVDVLPGDGDWTFRPAAMGSGVSSAEGGYNVAAGEFRGAWTTAAAERGGALFEMNLTAPRGTVGAVWVPLFGREAGAVEVLLDGSQVRTAEQRDGFLRLIGVAGGRQRSIAVVSGS